MAVVIRRGEDSDGLSICVCGDDKDPGEKYCVPCMAAFIETNGEDWDDG